VDAACGGVQRLDRSGKTYSNVAKERKMMNAHSACSMTCFLPAKPNVSANVSVVFAVNSAQYDSASQAGCHISPSHPASPIAWSFHFQNCKQAGIAEDYGPACYGSMPP